MTQPPLLRVVCKCEGRLNPFALGAGSCPLRHHHRALSGRGPRPGTPLFTIRMQDGREFSPANMTRSKVQAHRQKAHPDADKAAITY